MIEPNNLSPFRHFCMTIGAIPSSYKESLTYYEMLEWLCKYLQDTVIPAVNNNAEALEELQTAFVTLKDYVDHYFDNLDIQTEINNKLDDMAEHGELTDIIAQYLQLAGILAYDTVADLKAAENLVNGSLVKTYGYYSYNDNGGAFYKIRNIINTDVPDDATIIALSDVNLVAELIFDTLNVKQFGAKGDGVTDDTAAIKKAITLLRENPAQDKYYTTLYFPTGDYVVTDTLTFEHKRRCKIYGLATIVANMDKPVITLNDTMYCDFKDLLIKNDSTGSNAECLHIVDSYIFNFTIVNFRGGDKCVNIVNANNANFTQCGIRYGRIGVYSLTEPNNICNNFLECTIEGNTDYNVYLGYDRSIPNIFTFDKCYFEYDNCNIYVKYSTLVNIKNCYISCQASGGTAFEVDSPAGNPFKMNIFVKESLITGNDDAPSYLVKTNNNKCYGCITIDNKCRIGSNVTLYDNTQPNIGSILIDTPRDLQVFNTSMVVDSSNKLLNWSASGSAAYTKDTSYSEDGENSINITNAYVYKKVYLKKGVSYRFKTTAKNTGTGTARFGVYDSSMSTALVTTNTSEANATELNLYYIPESSGVYCVALRNNSTTTASFCGLRVISYEPDMYGLI